MTNNSDGSVTVEQGGYYCNYTGDNNYGGVSTATKVGLDGLRIFIEFEKVPTPTNDCWFGLSLLQQDHMFNTADMSHTGGYNPIIRYGVPNIEFHNPTFGGLGNSEIDGDLFALQSGDTLGMTVEYKYGQYIITYDHNDTVYEVPADKTKEASDLFISQGGKAYVVVAGSLLGENSDWKYTVSVSEGEALSQNQLSNRDFEQTKLSYKYTMDALDADVKSNYSKGYEFAWHYLDDEDVCQALNDMVDADNDMNDAYVAFDMATTMDELDEALAKAKSAKAKSAEALETIEFLAENSPYVYDDYDDVWSDDDYDDYDIYDENAQDEPQEGGILGFLKEHLKGNGSDKADNEFSEEEKETQSLPEEDESAEDDAEDADEEERESPKEMNKSRLTTILIAVFSVVIAVAICITVLIVVRKKRKTKL